MRPGEIFDAAVALFGRRRGEILLLLAVVQLPAAALTYWAGGDASFERRAELGAADLSVVVMVFLSLVGWTALVHLAGDESAGRRLDVGRLLGQAIADSPRVVLTSLLAGLILGLLFLCLILPGAIWLFYYVFLLPASALRGLGPRAALAYSRKLVVGRWWRTVQTYLYLAVPSLTASLFTYLAETLLPRSLPVYLGASYAGAVAGSLQIVGTTIFFLNEESVRGWRPEAAGPETPPAVIV